MIYVSQSSTIANHQYEWKDYLGQREINLPSVLKNQAITVLKRGNFEPDGNEYAKKYKHFL